MLQFSLALRIVRHVAPVVQSELLCSSYRAVRVDAVFIGAHEAEPLAINCRYERANSGL